jgi:hypothetical protein
MCDTLTFCSHWLYYLTQSISPKKWFSCCLKMDVKYFK